MLVRPAINKLTSNSSRFTEELPEPPPPDADDVDVLDAELVAAELVTLLIEEELEIRLDATLELELASSLDCALLLDSLPDEVSQA